MIGRSKVKKELELLDFGHRIRIHNVTSRNRFSCDSVRERSDKFEI